MKAALESPSQLRCASVRGKDKMKVAAEKIASKMVAQSPLFDSTDKACWPERMTAPTAKMAKMIDPRDRISRPMGPNMMKPASPMKQ